MGNEIVGCNDCNCVRCSSCNVHDLWPKHSRLWASIVFHICIELPAAPGDIERRAVQSSAPGLLLLSVSFSAMLGNASNHKEIWALLQLSGRSGRCWKVLLHYHFIGKQIIINSAIYRDSFPKLQRKNVWSALLFLHDAGEGMDKSQCDTYADHAVSQSVSSVTLWASSIFPQIVDQLSRTQTVTVEDDTYSEWIGTERMAHEGESLCLIQHSTAQYAMVICKLLVQAISGGVWVEAQNSDVAVYILEEYIPLLSAVAAEMRGR